VETSNWNLIIQKARVKCDNVFMIENEKESTACSVGLRE
jgi:hypothetical protein